MTGRFTAAAFALGFVLAASPGWADSENPDWPCVQRKVPSLTPAAVWTGPGFESAEGRWSDDEEVRRLVNTLSQRRLPLDEAEVMIEAFAAEAGDDATRRLTLLFAGLFETMNAERGEIMDGIERYGRRQKALAEGVREKSAEVDALRETPDVDPIALERAETDLIWQIRIFNERRSSLQYVCEVPRFVEQRLFALGRAISRAIP